MHDDVREALTHWLGADVHVVEELSDEALIALQEALTAAKRRQAAALAAASDEAFRQLPPVLRGTVSRIMGR